MHEMKSHCLPLLLVIAAVGVVTFIGGPSVLAAAPERPNIVVILCDDLGYGDVRALNPDRGKIPTPNIDRLTSGGWSQPREPSAAERQLPPRQLYDLSNDPGERRNIAADHPEIVERLTHVLEESIASGRTTPDEPQSNDVPVQIVK
jgi:arylsulfatase A-like enzyme